MRSAPHIVVVGGGIMGCCVARSLLRSGLRVTLIEKNTLGHENSASHDHHRLIRVAYGELSGYAAMAAAAFGAWERLWEEMGESHYVDSGTLIVGHRNSSWIQHSLAALESGTIAPRSAQAVAAVLPGYELGHEEVAALVRPGGILLANRIMKGVRPLLKDATLIEGVAVDAIDHSCTEVQLSNGRRLRADHVVCCTGSWSWPGYWPKGRDRTPSRQTALYLKPPDGESWDGVPFLLDLSARGGFYFVPPVDGLPAKLGTHRFSMQGSPEDSRFCSDAELAQLEAIRKERATFLRDWSIVGARACYYDVTSDERFLFNRLADTIYLGGFSGHGYKFAPLIGERVAGMVTGRLASEDFASWFAGHQMDPKP